MEFRLNKQLLQEWRTEILAEVAKPARTLFTMMCLFFSVIAFSQEPQPALKHGIYVRENTPCKSAPNAAIIEWDGIGFSGAHSSKCISRVMSRSGQVLQVRTSCSALGDGSPHLHGSEGNQEFALTVLSSVRFEIRKESRDQGTYRWCSEKVIDSK